MPTDITSSPRRSPRNSRRKRDQDARTGAAKGASPEVNDVALARGAARRNLARALTDEKGRVHPYIWLCFLSILLPVELTLRLGTLALTPYKIIMVCIAIPVVIQFFRTCKVTWLDGLFFGYALYTAMCIFINRGGAGVERVGILIFDTIIIYMIVRLSITSIGDLRRVLGVMITIFCILGLLAIPESILHWHFLHDIASKLTGVFYKLSDDVRFGMLRASSSFEHPILFGTAAGAMVTYGWLFGRTTFAALRNVIGICIAVFFSLSSAAFLMAFLQIGLLTAERWTRKIPRRGLIATLGIVFIFVVLSLASNRGPVKLFISSITLNPATGYYRLLIWENGIDDIFRNPIFGMKPEEWTRLSWMVDSIDNHWLLVAMHGGIPAFLFLVIFVFVTGNRVLNMRMPGAQISQVASRSGAGKTDTADADQKTGRRAPNRGSSSEDPYDARHNLDFRNAWVITAISLCFGATTVNYFGAMAPIFSFHLAIGTALLSLDESSAEENPDSPQDKRRTGRVRPDRADRGSP